MLCKDEKRLSIRKCLHWILRPSCSSLCCLGKWTWNQAVSPKKPERLELSKAKKTCCHLASFPNRRRVTKCSYFFQGFNQEHQGRFDLGALVVMCWISCPLKLKITTSLRHIKKLSPGKQWWSHAGRETEDKTGKRRRSRNRNRRRLQSPPARGLFIPHSFYSALHTFTSSIWARSALSLPFPYFPLIFQPL